MKHNPNNICHRFFTSPQWEMWEKEVQRRMKNHANTHADLYHKYVHADKNKKPAIKRKLNDYRFTGCWDTDEAMECGIISEAHLQDFFKFISQLKTKI